MQDATVIAVVTIICTCITTVVGLLVRSNVIGLAKTVNEQTVEIAGLHQTVIKQSAKLFNQETSKTAEIDKAVMDKQKSQPDQSYAAYPPFRPPDAKK